MKKVLSLAAVLLLVIMGSGSIYARDMLGATISPEDVTLRVGETVQVTLNPLENVEIEPGAVYMSSNESVITVNSNGLVTAVGEGTAYVFAGFNAILTQEDGSKLGVSAYSQNCTVTVTPAPEPPEGDYTTIYRLYNPIDGEHLFTSSELEVSTLTTQDNWRSEGVGWYAPVEGTPVYRLYNPELHNHLYTTDTLEVEYLTANEGWVKDFNGEPIFYAGGDIPIYRLYNPGLNGAHLLTTNENEFNVLPADGWIQEGIAFNALAVGN